MTSLGGKQTADWLSLGRMSGYSDPDRYPLMKAKRRQTLGVRAAGYGIGFLLYGIIGLTSGRLLGLDSIGPLHEHRFAFAVTCLVSGLALIVFGWRRSE